MNKQMEAKLKDHVAHFRPNQDCPWYSPARDITVLLPAIIVESLDTWDAGATEHVRILERLGRADKEINRVVNALADFMSKECIADVPSYEEALRKSGLLDVPAEIRLPVMAAIAEEMLGAFWIASRSTTRKKEDEDTYMITQYDPAYIAAKAAQVTKVLKLPGWKRRVTLWGWKLKAVLRRILGNDD